jgi:hypothetical protein
MGKGTRENSQPACPRHPVPAAAYIVKASGHSKRASNARVIKASGQSERAKLRGPPCCRHPWVAASGGRAGLGGGERARQVCRPWRHGNWGTRECSGVVLRAPAPDFRACAFYSAKYRLCDSIGNVVRLHQQRRQATRAQGPRHHRRALQPAVHRHLPISETSPRLALNATALIRMNDFRVPPRPHR